MKLKRIESSSARHAMQTGFFESDSGSETAVFFRTRGSVPLTDHTDHFFMIGVVAAYLRGEPYTHHGEVSQELYDNLGQAMQKWQAWWRLPAIKVTAQTRTSATDIRPRRRRGCLMTGGVDSLFTAHTQSSRIDAFVHVSHCSSADQSSASSGRDRSSTTLESLTRALEKSYYLVETNLMTAFPEIEDSWASISHGACYATVGHFLSEEIGALLISASFASDQMRPWGSHPETDGLYSSERLTFRHIGADHNRFQKHRVIAADALYLQHLSVCSHGPQSGPHINCSSCQKCLRSMITLDLLGIDRTNAPTFDWRHYRPDNLRTFLLQGAVNTQELLDYAEEIGREDIASVLRDVIAYVEKYNWIIQAELFLRRRFNKRLKYKPALKRVRRVVYQILGIRPRHQSPHILHSDQTNSNLPNLEQLHD